MTTQRAVITATPNLAGTKTVQLFAVGGDVALYTGTVSALAVALGQFVCTFGSLVPAGVYVMILFHNGVPAATGQRVFTGTDGEWAQPTSASGSATVENQTLMLQKLANIEGAGFTGPHTVTVTVTSASVPLAGARVAFARNGLSQTKTTNGSGVVTFTVDPGTYTWAATCAGFAGASGSQVVDGNEAVPVALTALYITPSASPGLTTGFLVALDVAGAVEAGAVFSCQLVRGPSGSGYGFDNEVRTATAAVTTGLVEFAGLIKGGTYYIWRGDKKDKTERLVPADAGSTWAITNLAGKEVVA
jgi:hypothetical protein